MRRFAKKLTATVLAGAMAVMATLAVNQTTVKAAESEKQKGIIYCNFKEYTNIDELEVGTHYLFLARHYDDGEAVVGIPSGSAELYLAGKFDDSHKTINEYGNGTYDSDEMVTDINGSERYLSYYYAGRMGDFYQGAVDVVESGKGFDTCNKGTIAFISDDDIDLKALTRVKKTDFEGFCNLKYLDLFDESKLESQIKNLQNYGLTEDATMRDYFTADLQYVYSLYKQYYPEDMKDVTFEQFVVNIWGYESVDAYIESRMDRYMMDIEDGRKAWRYGCDGGGVSYVGPMYLYSYDTKEFTEDDLALESHFVYEGGEKVITTEDVTVLITVDGKTYYVSDFTVDEENNSVNLDEKDNTVNLKVGTVSLTLEVPIVYIPDADAEEVETPETNQITNITPAIKGNDLSATIADTVIDKVFNITEDEKTTGAWVWMELDVKEKEEVPAEDVAIIEKALGDKTFGMYLTINMFKQVPGEDKVQVATTGVDAVISIVVPEELRKPARKFSVIYTHDGGDAKIIEPVAYDESTGVLTFKANEFSTYALIYADPVAAPPTGDTTPIMIYVVLMGIAGAGMAVVSRKRKEVK